MRIVPTSSNPVFQCRKKNLLCLLKDLRTLQWVVVSSIVASNVALLAAMRRVVLLTSLLSSAISIHYVKGFEISDYPDFDNEEEEGSMVIVPDRLDYLYKKRMKDIEFFGVFLVVTGIPILWVLSTLFFARY